MRLKKTLQILSLSTWDYAGCGYFLSEAINETTDHESRAVVSRISRLKFPTDVVTSDEDEIKALWRKADVIHIHDGSYIPKDVPPRPVVITWHGSIYRKKPQHYNRLTTKHGWLATAATLDLTLFGPRWLPDTRPDLASYRRRRPGFHVCQAPTKLHVKSTSEVKAAAKVFNFDLIRNVTWEQCLKRKGKADVLVDQFHLCYGCNAIEAWLMGIPVIANAKDQRVIQMIEQNAPDGFPFVRCADKPREIRAALEQLRDDKEHYEEFARRGRLYAEYNHSYRAVAERAVDIYYEALESFYNRSAGIKLVQHPDLGRKATRQSKPKKSKRQLIRGGPLVLLRYVGRDHLVVTYWGENTDPPASYKFGRSKPLNYVHLEDVQPFLEMRDGERKVFVEEKV